MSWGTSSRPEQREGKGEWLEGKISFKDMHRSGG